MARKAKGSGFKMRSGNSTPFKHMGSSPVKYTNLATGDDLNPYAPDVIQTMGAMGVSGDVLEQMIKNKTKEEEEQIESGQKIDTKTEIKNNVPKVEKIKKVKLKKTNMDELRAKQKRSSKGQSEYQYRQTKEYKDSKKAADKVEKPVDLTKTKVGPVETSGGASFTPSETSESSFSDAFAAARKKFGPGKEFDYKGEKYTTDRADDHDYGKYKHTDKIMENFSTTPKIILTDELNNPAVPEVPSVEKGFNYGDDEFDYSSPIEKKSPYKKGLGKYAKKAKGKRGYKMKRK